MLMAGAPFILLDDARPDGRQTLYRDPKRIICARRYHEVLPALAELRAAVAAGRHAAGWIGYDAGFALDPKLEPLARGPANGLPLLWFGMFDRAERLDGTALESLLPDPEGAWIGPARPRVSRAWFDAAFADVQRLIAAGDIYQANLSFRAAVSIQGDPLAIYARLRANARAGWGGVVHDGTDWLLSLSPETFFRTDGGRIQARPMKGTAPRADDPHEDAALAAALAADTKQRAENLMIVDLIRNDLSRIARPGSVVTPNLFQVEHYPTVHQMVSEVEAEALPGRDAIDILLALFPCGSITGAPKLRAMEVIAAVEDDPRGAYTGTIGTIDPHGDAAFNVAIRTLVLEKGKDEARIGLGSAIVADSTADEEWRECLAKAAFLTAGAPRFDLFETMRFDTDQGISRLDDHLARMGASARQFDFAFDRHEIRNELHAATFRLMAPARVRVTLGRSGAVAIQVTPLPPIPTSLVEVKIVPLPVDASDFRLRHKTTDRAFYDDSRRAANMFEVIFARPDGYLTEGSFTNLFVPRDGILLTPPLARGLLPGVRRAMLLESGEAVEADLTEADLTGEFLLANDLRGVMKARLA